MFWINRAYLDGVGHSECLYKNITLNFFAADSRPKADDVGNTFGLAANGVGKTSLIALLLSVFEPDKRKFVQTMRSKNSGIQNHKYEDYFRRSLSTILVEMLDDNGRTLLIGQFHQKRQDVVDVVYFICDARKDLYGNPFEHVPSLGRSVEAGRQPEFTNTAAARQWVLQETERSSFWRLIPNHTELRKALIESHVNLAMIQALLTMNSEEGGIANFLRFKNENNFLARFFACTISRERAVSLHETCMTEVAEHKKLNSYRAEGKFFDQVLKRWQNFVPLGEKVVHEEKTIMEQKIRCSERLRDLKGHGIQQSEVLDRLQRAVAGAETKLALEDQQLTRKERLFNAWSLKITERERADAKTAWEEASQKLKALQRYGRQLKAVGPFRKLQKAKEALKRGKAILEAQLTERHHPLVEAHQQAARIAKRVFKDLIDARGREHHDASVEAVDTDRMLKENQEKLKDSNIRLGGVETERSTCRNTLEKAVDALQDIRKKGLVGSDETPEQAQGRLRSEYEFEHKRLKAASETLNSKEEVCKKFKDEYPKAEYNLKILKERLDNIEEKHRKLQGDRESISQALHSAEVCHHIDQEEIISGQLKEFIAGAIKDESRCREERDKTNREINRIAGSGHPLQDEVVTLAHQSLLDSGMGEEQIWPYPAYLAEVLQDDAEKVAAIIDADPGRYLGLVVVDEGALAKVKTLLDTRKWLHRPVPIYLLDETGDVNPGKEVPDALLAPVEKTLYSLSAWQQRQADLKEILLEQEKELGNAEIRLGLFRGLGRKWQDFLTVNASEWPKVIEARDRARQDRERAEQNLEDLKKRIEKATEEAKKQQAVVTDTEKNVKLAVEAKRQIEDFFLRHWDQKLKAEVAQLKLDGELASLINGVKKLETERENLSASRDGLIAAKNRLSSELRRLRATSNTELANIDPASEPHPGLPPDQAMENVKTAWKDLQAFIKSPELKSLEEKVAACERSLEARKQELDAEPGWHAEDRNEKVKELATRESSYISEQLRSNQEEVHGADSNLRECKAGLNQAESRYENAKRKAPAEIIELDLGGELEAWKARQSETQQQILKAKQTIGGLKAEFREYKAQLGSAGKLMERIDRLADRLSTVVEDEEAGIAKPIADFDAFEGEANTAYKECRSSSLRLEKVRKEAQGKYYRLHDLMRLEKAKDEEVRRGQKLLARWGEVTLDKACRSTEIYSRAINDMRDCNEDRISRIQQSIEMTVSDLTSHLIKAIQLLKEAKRVRIPRTSPLKPNKHVMQLSDEVDKLEKQSLTMIASNALQRWIEEGQVPGVGQNLDNMTASLIQTQIPEGRLNFKLIKANENEVTKYDLLGELEGSGGQLLTTAFLLYLTIAKVREKDAGIAPFGFMLCDNPVGTSNADRLVRAQLLMARSVGIQLIFLTAVKDENVMRMFEKFIFLFRKKKLKRGGITVGVDEKDFTVTGNELVRAELSGEAGVIEAKQEDTDEVQA